MKRLCYSVLMAMVIVLTSCANLVSDKRVTGNGKMVTKNISVSDFQEISVGQAIRLVFVQQSGQPKVEVRTDENILPLLDIAVKDGELNVRYKQNAQVRNAKTVVTVHAADLSGIKASSASSVELLNGLNRYGKLEIETSSAASLSGKGTIQCKELSLEASSASSLKLSGVKTDILDCEASSGANVKVEAVKADRVDCEVSSGSGVDLSGSAREVDLDASSGAGIDAGDLKAETGQANASSGARVKCNVTGGLSRKTSSGGSVVNG